MTLKALSTCITSNNIDSSRRFYTEHFAAQVIFDCGWYINLDLGQSRTIQFMEPRDAQRECDPEGLTFNLHVEDVDDEYGRLTAAGLDIVLPIEDHPWGDRGFAIRDPNGIMLYIYSDREPSAEFKQFIKA
jgi:catechol 2,3-dioxygenase-like lactoylglutathione lyase family enzyme